MQGLNFDHMNIVKEARFNAGLLVLGHQEIIKDHPLIGAILEDDDLALGFFGERYVVKRVTKEWFLGWHLHLFIEKISTGEQSKLIWHTFCNFPDDTVKIQIDKNHNKYKIIEIK